MSYCIIFHVILVIFVDLLLRRNYNINDRLKYYMILPICKDKEQICPEFRIKQVFAI